MNEGLLSIFSASKMLITLEPHGIFESHFAYYNIFYHCPTICKQNGDKALLRIILASGGILVKMLITLELHHIF